MLSALHTHIHTYTLTTYLHKHLYTYVHTCITAYLLICIHIHTAVMGINFKSLFVRKTHIRYKSFLEIYTELGGIYAASIAILAFIFVKRYVCECVSIYVYCDHTWVYIHVCICVCSTFCCVDGSCATPWKRRGWVFICKNTHTPTCIHIQYGCFQKQSSVTRDVLVQHVTYARTCII